MLKSIKKLGYTILSTQEIYLSKVRYTWLKYLYYRSIPPVDSSDSRNSFEQVQEVYKLLLQDWSKNSSFNISSKLSVLFSNFLLYYSLGTGT